MYCTSHNWETYFVSVLCRHGGVTSANYMVRQHYFWELSFISCILGIQIIHRSNQNCCKSLSGVRFKMSLIIFYNLCLHGKTVSSSQYKWVCISSPSISFRPAPRLGREHFTLLSPLLHDAFPRETTSFFPWNEFLLVCKILTLASCWKSAHF
jgi:hypothetical protein